LAFRAALGLLILFWCSPAAAQGAPSGFELALHGSTTVLEGRPAQFRGVAYRVLGLAALEPLARAHVRARYATDVAGSGDWSEVSADARGFFEIEVAMPAHPEGSPRLEVEVGDGRAQRVFRFPLGFEQPWRIDLVTDRQLYEPGEAVHVWARVRDVRSLRPLVGQKVELTVTGTAAANRPVTTTAAGIAAMTVKLPEQSREGEYGVVARIGNRSIERSFRIGTRTYERLLTEVEVTPETAEPHQAITVRVKVTTASGAPVKGGAVEVEVDTEKASGTTDAHGVATIAMHAPAYLSHPTGSVAIVANVSHPAHGSAVARGTLRLAVPLTLEVEAVPPNGGLVPEVDGLLYVKLSEGSGKPAPVGTPVEVRGAAIRNRVQRANSDAHGLVAIPTRLPIGASADQGGGAQTTVVVHVGGAAPRTAAISVAVLRDAEVVPTVSPPVVAPGEPISVTVARRASAARVPVVVELLSDTGVVEARVLGAGASSIALKAPADRLGVIQVRARPIHQRHVVEGTGGIDAFIVRPARASFPALTADRTLYNVRAKARLTLTTTAGAPQSWAAVLVRDLAAHGGERAFDFAFLDHAFDRAILDPNGQAAQSLLRTALAAHVYAETAPVEAPALVDALGQPLGQGYGLEQSAQRGVLRDPYPLADELARRGVGPVMNKLEALLASALADDRLAEVTTGTGPRRDFRADVLGDLEDVPSTLGDGKLTLAMIYAADRAFTYERVARRVARVRLVNLLVALAHYLDPGDDATPEQRTAAREPYDRWLPRMVEQGLIDASQLLDPWGGSFTLRRSRNPELTIAVEAAGLELVSPGPDGVLGTRDDVSDPFARAVPAGTPYAVASGEDRLMELLSRMSPGAEVLRRLQEAYRRVTAEVAEEETGDAVSASVSEGIYGGLVGSGVGGGGSGVGYGSGSGRLAGRTARAPKVRMGQANVRGGMARFAGVVRERFPATLLFAPAAAVDPSGKTELEIPLSEAVTTYLVEVVVWSSDGWTWSTKTRIRVDKETVIDAPVPRYATVGDKLRLPVRVGNRTARDRVLAISVFASDRPEEPLVERGGIRVPARDSLEVPVEMSLTRPDDGKVTVGVASAQGAPLDAVRRPLVVYRPTRRVRRSVDMLTDGTGTLALEVPAQAMPREGAEVAVRVGDGMFVLPDRSPWAAWAAAWAGRPLVDEATMSALEDGRGVALARAIGTAWGEGRVDDQVLANALGILTQDLASSESDAGAGRSGEQVEVLLCLAPSARRVGARPELASDLEAVLRSLRKTIEAHSAEAADDPHLWALTAAALAATAPSGSKLERVAELVRRARRYQLEVGSYTWVASRNGGHATSALLALAELALGERERAFALLRTLGRFDIDGRVVGDWPRALARVAVSSMTGGKSAEEVGLRIDGQVTRAKLSHGIARVPAAVLGRPGSHAIALETPGKGPALFYVEATTEYGLPWEIAPARPGSLVVSLEGESKARDERAELELVVRNRSPRAIAAPIVEVSVPAGAELDEEGRAAILRHTAAAPEATRGTLRLVLAGLPPGRTARVPLPFRWSVGGTLHGFGVAAFPADRPEDLSVLPPRAWKIEEAPPRALQVEEVKP